MFEDEGLLDDTVSVPNAPQGELGEPSSTQVRLKGYFRWDIAQSISNCKSWQLTYLDRNWFIFAANHNQRAFLHQRLVASQLSRLLEQAFNFFCRRVLLLTNSAYLSYQRDLQSFRLFYNASLDSQTHLKFIYQLKNWKGIDILSHLFVDLLRLKLIIVCS